MTWAAPVLIAVALVARTPDQRQALVDLAYVLGEAHALRQACAGIKDQTFRLKMNRMIEVEQPEEIERRRLVERFNAGFMTRQAEYPACGPAVENARRATAERGERLARRLAGDEP
jgi:uncharacterized protein (TIGR02301 family)